MPKEDPFVNRAQLLKAIKKYPEIWDSNNKLHMCRSVTSPMWTEIAEQFGGHVPTVKLQSIWSQMKYHYHNLVHRQILHKERFNTKWEHFEPMSFMYNITVSKIVGAQSNSSGNSNDSAGSSLEDQHSTVQPQSPTTTTSSSAVTAASSSGTGTSSGRGRPSGSFSWLPQPPPQPPTGGSGGGGGDATQLPHLIEQQSLTTTPTTTGGGGGYTAFTGLVPPAAIMVVAAAAAASNTPIRKLGRPSSLHNSMRGRIIDAIKARPTLWAGRQQRPEKGQGQSRTSAVWKEVAIEMGLTATLMQTRWSIIKQRYVDELQKERHSQAAHQVFRSNWEHFDRMSFMRDILLKKVDEREQTREHIQEMVSEQQQHQHQQLQPLPLHLQHYRPPPGLTGLADHAQDMPIGLVQHQLSSQHHHDIHHHHHHPSLGLQHSHVGGSTRRRVKHESDLEWDPFEMILHVHGNGEPAAN
ncbi:uncharacterized protein [Drosophila tropicalis]|uniref:uncharacterized protein n=1 Tax=Drosophila tropicalis TaxID=46794 RepID=UPI0035ABB38B